MFAIERHTALRPAATHTASLPLARLMRNVVICVTLFLSGVAIIAGHQRAWAGPTGSTVITLESLKDGQWPPNTGC